MAGNDTRTTRRELLKRAGTGAAVVVYGGMGAKTAVAGAPKYRGRWLANELRILQRVDFVPAYDSWFDSKYVKE